MSILYRRLGLAIGIVSSGSGLGQLFLAPLMQEAIKRYGLGEMFLFAGAFQVALLPTVLAFRKPKALVSKQLVQEDTNPKSVSWWLPLKGLIISKPFMLFLLSHCKCFYSSYIQLLACNEFILNLSKISVPFLTLKVCSCWFLNFLFYFFKDIGCSLKIVFFPIYCNPFLACASHLCKRSECTVTLIGCQFFVQPIAAHYWRKKSQNIENSWQKHNI